MKFQQTNLISFHVLNCKIHANKDLFQNLVPNDSKRKKHLEDVINPLMSFQSLSNSTTNFENFVPLLQILSESGEYISNTTILSAVEKLYPQLVLDLRRNSNINTQLPYFYYITTIIKRLFDELSTFKNSEKKQISTIHKNLKSIIMSEFFPKIFENGKFLISQVIYDKNVIQRFNPNVYHSEFKDMEFLLLIIKNLSIPLTRELKIKQIPLLIRTSKRWNGTLLIQNLNFLYEEKLEIPEVYYNCVDNQFTLFEFYPNSQRLILRGDISNDDQKLLYEAITTNLLTFYSEDSNNKFDGFETKKSLVPLCVLGKRLQNVLSEKQLLDLFIVLGNDRSNYLKGFQEEFSRYKFKNKTFEELVKILKLQPPFVDNHYLNEQFKQEYSNYLFDSKNEASQCQINNIYPIFIKKQFDDMAFNKLIENNQIYNDDSLTHILNLLMVSLETKLNENFIYNIASIIAGNELNTNLKDKEKILFILLSVNLMIKKNEMSKTADHEENQLNGMREIKLGKAFEAVLVRLSRQLLTSNYYHHHTTNFYKQDENGNEVAVKLNFYRNMSFEDNIDTKIQKFNNAFKITPKSDHNPNQSHMSDYGEFEASDRKDIHDPSENYFETNIQEAEEILYKDKFDKAFMKFIIYKSYNQNVNTQPEYNEM